MNDEVRAILTEMRTAVGGCYVAFCRDRVIEAGMRKLVADMNRMGVKAVYYADLDEEAVAQMELPEGTKVGRA